MKVSISWLGDFLDLPTEDPSELEQILASLGHEVDEIEYVRPTFEGVVVARVEQVGPHPNADKIRLCRVDDGTAVHEVVCGAWNFESDAIVAYAPVGSRLNTDTDDPFEIGARELRGVLSHGMISSARELGLGDDHEGILVLDTLGAATEADIGRRLEEVIGLSDAVLDVTITPNRGDCMSIRGLARELAAYWDIPWQDVHPELSPSELPPSFTITIEDTDACPRFVGYEIDDVSLGQSPLWMQLRLMAVGQRPISNVVDVSNYVMLELGHPIHTFDADKLADHHVIARMATEDETLKTLDGSDRSLLNSDIVVADPSGPVAIAGVMGGAETEVSEGTSNVLVEAAHWDPPSVLFTSHRLGLRSEASARFERGVDPNLSHLAAARAAELIAEACGGTPRADLVDTYPSVVEPWILDLSAHDVSRLLGPLPDFDASCDLLERLAFSVERTGETSARVTVPTYRRDVVRPVDLVEEVARLHGFDNFADTVPRGPTGTLTDEQAATRALRTVLVGAGLSEAQTLSFIGQADLDTLRLPEGDPRRVGLRVKNPLREEESTMRTTLLPGLLAAAARNVGHGIKEVGLFETGRVFLKEPDTDDFRIPLQPVKLAFVLVGADSDVFSGTGLVEVIGQSVRRELSVMQAALAAMHPGRAGEIQLDNVVIGFVGELHPSVARDVGLEGRVVVGEMDVDPLVTPLDPWKLDDVSVFPPHVFDLAFVISDSISAGDAARVVRRSAGPHLESAEIFDEYRGGALPQDHRSLAFRVTLRAMDRTLSDEQAGPIRKSIIHTVTVELDGSLRGSE